jgi:hypothetical protein
MYFTSGLATESKCFLYSRLFISALRQGDKHEIPKNRPQHFLLLLIAQQYAEDNMMDEQKILKAQLEILNEEHRQVDKTIEELMTHNIVDRVSVQRLKKRKLLIKDQMNKIYSRLTPDIIA